MPNREKSAPFKVAISVTPHAESFGRAIASFGVEIELFGEKIVDAGAVPIDQWIGQLAEGSFDDVIFTSAQGVHMVVEMANQLGYGDSLLSALNATRKLAIGKRPARALSELRIEADEVVEKEDLSLALSRLHLKGRTVGIQPLAQNAQNEIATLIEREGGRVRLVAPTTTVDPDATELLAKLSDGTIGAIAFLTERSAAWLFDACRVSGSGERLLRILRQVPVIVADVAADGLRRRGLHPDLILDHASIMSPNPHELSLTLGLSEEESTKHARAVGRHRVVIVGNGMVGYKLCESLTDSADSDKVHIVALGEESIPAYDRVHLSEYFSGKTAQDLILEPVGWYEERGIDLRLEQRGTRIDREARIVTTDSGEEFAYDSLVLATGGEPFVPPLPGLDKKGVFVYRTVKDLEDITAYAKHARSAAVIGGGLLGLEAAKAAKDLGLTTHVLEMAPRLMPRQLDDAGSALLRKEIEALGVRVHVGKRTTGVAGTGHVSGISFADGELLAVDMIIVSAGIKPRDEIARTAGLRSGERGGILVDDTLRTNDPNIFAIGECAIHEGTLYGLVAPGYEMARVVAKTILGETTLFKGADMSTQLKLLGVEVGSLGNPFADESDDTACVIYHDLVAGVYKKLIVDKTGKKLLGAILVGDSSEFGTLLPYAQSGDDLPIAPDELLFGSRGGGSAALPMPDTAQVCSCNNVTKLDIVQAIDANLEIDLGGIKKCTKAGTGCGGCLPVVTDLFNAEMKARGQTIKKAICEHFDYSRQELFDLVRVGGIEDFGELLKKHGTGHGCEICKPVAGSIFATTSTIPIMDHQMLQDTNDRFLANIQRKGLYSVVPRIPGGEITPDKLIVIGQVAKKYDLYTKITGGQRIDLFGARLDQLPEIWEELIAAGFESGHAYAKSLRTVKSCVGSTWCRYGVGDSVGFAIRVENRYKGLRSPHKLKSAVSGCTRECAEAQSKDFGLIATEHGYNLYVGGNGGTKPRHADLLAADIDEDTAIKYIDRFLMYYIRTADKLQRTAPWIDKIEGGIEHVKKVVVEDSLGLGAQLEADIQALIDGYICEWKDAVETPEKRDRFRHFAGENKESPPVSMLREREQRFPGPWPDTAITGKVRLPVLKSSWVRVAKIADVPEEGGTAVRYGDSQLAVFHFKSKGKCFVTQNMCPHKKEMILARGLLGDAGGVPKVACAFHKKTFNLETGDSLTDEDLSILTFETKVSEGWIMAELPSEAELADTFRKNGCIEDCAQAAE